MDLKQIHGICQIVFNLYVDFNLMKFKNKNVWKILKSIETNWNVWKSMEHLLKSMK